MSSFQNIDLVIEDGGEYINKNKRCLWFRTHDGKTFKYAIADEEFAQEHKLPTQLEVPAPPAVATDKP
jgi:hypothetical protein